MPSFPFQFSQSLGPCTGGGIAGDSLGIELGIIGGNMLGDTVGGHSSGSVGVLPSARQAEAMDARVSCRLQRGKHEPTELDEFLLDSCAVWGLQRGKS